jgi:hypothetical protein
MTTEKCYNDCPFLQHDGEWICLLSGRTPENMDIELDKCSQLISYRKMRAEEDGEEHAR